MCLILFYCPNFCIFKKKHISSHRSAFGGSEVFESCPFKIKVHHEVLFFLECGQCYQNQISRCRQDQGGNSCGVAARGPGISHLRCSVCASTTPTRGQRQPVPPITAGHAGNHHTQRLRCVRWSPSPAHTYKHGSLGEGATVQAFGRLFFVWEE